MGLSALANKTCLRDGSPRAFKIYTSENVEVLQPSRTQHTGGHCSRIAAAAASDVQSIFIAPSDFFGSTLGLLDSATISGFFSGSSG